MLPGSASGIVERTVPSARRQSGVVKTSSVGTFGMCGGRRRLRLGGAPARLRVQADRQIGAVAVEPDRVEAALVQLAAARLEPLDVLLPGGDGVGLVEADACSTSSHSRSTSGSPNTVLAQPSFG